MFVIILNLFDDCCTTLSKDYNFFTTIIYLMFKDVP